MYIYIIYYFIRLTYYSLKCDINCNILILNIYLSLESCRKDGKSTTIQCKYEISNKIQIKKKQQQTTILFIYKYYVVLR